jgi:ACS family hexuronate transporter-like MFS transporter
MLDALGTRRGFAIIMLFWSLACAAHSLATSFAMLAACRLLLGAGEGGGFPAATRVVAEWFPVKERSTAMGIMNAGTGPRHGGGAAAHRVRAVVHELALDLRRHRRDRPSVDVLVVADVFPSRAASAARGGGTCADPAHRPGGTGRGHGARLAPAPALPADVGPRHAKFLSDAAWYFYLFWLPKYLYDARGFDIKTVGTFAWIPPAAAGLGCLVGGWFSSALLQRNLPLDRAPQARPGRERAGDADRALRSQRPVAWAIALFSLAYFGQQSWSTLVMILPTDIFPKATVGAVAGLVGFGGAMGGVVFGQLVGYLLDHGYGYGVVFALAGSLHVVAFATICLAIPRIQTLAEARA